MENDNMILSINFFVNNHLEGLFLRYLKFNNIYIDTDNQLMIRDGESFNLAPKVYDLLLFFCQNPQRVISKDELMDKVWTGTLVTENAISRTLVKVRKALGDDPKNSKFIMTVPRKGYRMVAEFQETDNVISLNINGDATLADVNLNNNEGNYAKRNQLWGKDSPLKITLITIGMLLISWLFYSQSYQPAEKIATKQLKPLTREIGDEQHPEISPDLNYIAYTKMRSGKPSYINIENLADHSKMTVSHARGKLSRPVWSPTENKLAFLYQHNHVCMIFWAEISEIKDKDSWQTISECGSNSWPHFVFSPDGKNLYFNDKQLKTNGYQIFRVDLENLQKDIVNQPITNGQGNYAFDISPNGKQLVMLNSEFAPQTRIYTLELANAKLNQTAQLPYLMRSVNWHHDNLTIVHPSPHPAYELWQSTLSGEKIAVVASNTSRVKQVSRINNGADFAFVSYLLNRDIYFQSHGKEEAKGLDNSSVMDYLPTLANKSHQYAFVSKRSTTAEVYIAKWSNAENRDNITQDSSVNRLTFFNNPVKIYQLAFSPNDKQLMILADNQIFIADVVNGVIKKLSLENMAINGASWQDEQTLLFSSVQNNDWSLKRYNITTEKVSEMPVGYQGGVYSLYDKHFYLLSDEKGQVMRIKDLQQPPQATELFCPTNFFNRQLNLKVTPEGLVCLSSMENGGNQLVQYLYSDQSVTPWQKLPTNIDYQVNEFGVIYSVLTQSVADIMQTSTR
jgi:transcriptional activator of cad operon